MGMKVTVKEIVNALREIAKMPIHTISEAIFELADRIEAHGIEHGGEPVAIPCSYPDCQSAQGCVGSCKSPFYTAPPSIDALIAEIDALINPELHSLIQLKSVLAIIDKYRGQKK